MSKHPDPATQRRGVDDSRGPTLFVPPPEPLGETRRKGRTRGALSLPPELRRQATRRLRITALAFAAAFLLADFVPVVFIREFHRRFLYLEGWLPSTLSILTGLVVAAVASLPRLSWNARVDLGLLFQVAGSYGIALAQCLWLRRVPFDPHLLHDLTPGWIGIWMLFYTVVVPASPGRALLAALGSATAMPVVLALVLGPRLIQATTPLGFFFSYVFPYLICMLLAYLGARVIYRLGTDVSRALELGSYRLERRLGRGGMGEVWRASHRLLARPAAIKFIRPEAIAGSNPEESRALVRRFELEAKATAFLTSAHTVDLYDFGVTEDGAFYYVMELLDGLDLDELVRRFGPLPPARIVHVLGQACESLEEAHAKGLIHRDVKPANIYACRSGSRCDFVKVLDFGLVAHRRALTTREERLTLPEQMTGTPAFMPPEVARGGVVDARADLYALGCVAYWLATGRSVFRGGTLYEIVSQHLSAAPELPSRHAPDDLPAELERVMLQCLEKEPDRRPKDARTLAAMLRAVPLRDRWNDEDAEVWWSVNLPVVEHHAKDGLPERAGQWAGPRSRP